MTKAQLLDALGDRDVQLNRAAEILFRDDRWNTLERPRVVEIAVLSVLELGFPEGATYEELLARARKQQLVECPMELGPHLRLQFVHQAEVASDLAMTHGCAPPASMTIATRPLDDGEGTPKGFYLRRVGGVPWLRGYWSPAEHIWRPEDVLVFDRGVAA